MVASAEHQFMRIAPRVGIRWMQDGLDLIVSGAFLVFAGAQLLMGRIWSVLGLWLGAAVGIAAVRPFLEIPPGSPIGAMSLFVAVSLVVFAMPSRAALQGLSAHEVGRARDVIVQCAPSTAQLERLRKGMDVYGASVTERNARISWALGIAWGALSWLLLRNVLGDGLTSAQRNAALGVQFGWIVAFFIAAFVHASYTVAAQTVGKTIDLAFIDAATVLAREATVEELKP
ncbi:hypothetical protein P3W24_12285 [Luteibacter sp. PPL201]|uniref:Uncharacterized protein n=1 Tax=Luteibacter sahnii TaxID=3021977 RepID=A0ABT6BC85_9GAMM